MKTVDFKRLFKSIDEARKIHKGTMKPSRKFTFKTTVVKFSRQEWKERRLGLSIRERLSLVLELRLRRLVSLYSITYKEIIKNNEEIVFKVWYK
jgi:hypothetical protein